MIELSSSCSGLNFGNWFVDGRLKAFGFDNIYALGDCAAVNVGNSLNDDMVKLFRKADADGGGSLDRPEVLKLFADPKLGETYPQAAVLKFKLDDAFDAYDADQSGELDEEEFSALLKELDADMRSLPPTAQVAGQQGGYLAAQFNGETEDAFKYFHKGSMAYIGQDKAAAQVSIR